FLMSGHFSPGCRMRVASLTGRWSTHFCTTRATLTTTSSRSFGNSSSPPLVTHVLSLVNLMIGPTISRLLVESLPSTSSVNCSKPSTNCGLATSLPITFSYLSHHVDRQHCRHYSCHSRISRMTRNPVGRSLGSASSIGCKPTFSRSAVIAELTSRVAVDAPPVPPAQQRDQSRRRIGCHLREEVENLRHHSAVWTHERLLALLEVPAAPAAQ